MKWTAQCRGGAAGAALLLGALVLAGCGGAPESAEPGGSPDESHLAEAPAEFTGWIAVRRDLTDEALAPGYFSREELEGGEGWARITGLRWSSAGSRVPVVIDGEATGYEVELHQVSYGGRVPVLKLAVYREGVEMALAYTWAAPDSRRIGINLRWMQAGLTRIED
ncbi:MAG: hypothetical protein ISN29_04620 [Gammaproteobacteria bacterium AqS3]|nr:hypothetical protein [Gammaproteobacteria bacterium AqS3]